MKNNGINNSTESPGGLSQEIDHLRLESCAAIGKGKSKRHSCSIISTKLEATAYVENNSKEAVARKFRVGARRIREWCQKKLQSSRLERKQTLFRLKVYQRVGVSQGLVIYLVI